MIAAAQAHTFSITLGTLPSLAVIAGIVMLGRRLGRRFLARRRSAE